MTDPFSAFRRVTPASRALYERAWQRIPGGVSSNVKFFPPYPIFMSRAAGSKIYDVDGREYIDYCLAFGPLIAGHGAPSILEAIRTEIERSGTTIFGTPSAAEIALAERLAGLIPSAEMTRFTSSGTEATMHALRIARAATGRPKIVKFEGHYHGVHDAVLVNLDGPVPRTPASDGIPAAVLDDTIVVPFGDAASVARLLADDPRIGAVIVEPIARGAIQPDPRFLHDLRTVTRAHGAVLIFDEIVTWPRVGLGGAQGLYGVTPDLTALGKALGGGLPVGAVVGRRDLMSITAPPASRADAPAGIFTSAAEPYVFHGGTYNGTPSGLAAGLALLDMLQQEGAMPRLLKAGERMRGALADLFARREIPAQVIGTGAVFDFYFTENAIRSSRDIWSSNLDARRALDYRLLVAGIYNSPLHRFHLSLAHSDSDLERTLRIVEEHVGDHGNW
jgi:glutamate-1-semialdehyde 2,1-aminomutase